MGVGGGCDFVCVNFSFSAISLDQHKFQIGSAHSNDRKQGLHLKLGPFVKFPSFVSLLKSQSNMAWPHWKTLGQFLAKLNGLLP